MCSWGKCLETRNLQEKVQDEGWGGAGAWLWDSLPIPPNSRSLSSSFSEGTVHLSSTVCSFCVDLLPPQHLLPVLSRILGGCILVEVGVSHFLIRV